MQAFIYGVFITNVTSMASASIFFWPRPWP